MALSRCCRGRRPPPSACLGLLDATGLYDQVRDNIDRLQQSRAVATRHDNRGYVVLATATAAALTIWLRT